MRWKSASRVAENLSEWLDRAAAARRSSSPSAESQRRADRCRVRLRADGSRRPHHAATGVVPSPAADDGEPVRPDDYLMWSRGKSPWPGSGPNPARKTTRRDRLLRLVRAREAVLARRGPTRRASGTAASRGDEPDLARRARVRAAAAVRLGGSRTRRGRRRRTFLRGTQHRRGGGRRRRRVVGVRHGLRGLDAIHVASALELADSTRLSSPGTSGSARPPAPRASPSTPRRRPQP